jgi:serine/threonine protein kinase
VITNSGLRLGERYVLNERLAVGGMGEVWSAKDEVLNRPVAVKVLRNDLAPDTAFQARFRAEARTAAALSHGGIAAVYDYGEMLGSAYLVMELVPGEALSAMISREGALGTDRTLQIVAQSARALHAAHQHGVIHRDIKPANLMITPELRVKVTDFGIARPRDHEPLTATGQVMGTAHYLAPELARGEIASPLSDVYALGVVAYECLAGWRPFDGDNQVAVATAHLQDEPPPLPATIPGPVRAVVMQAMAKNPAERPQGANALAALMEDLRLRGLAGGQANSARPDPDQVWPTDAQTPPRGHAPQAPQQQYQQPSSRREAALNRQADPSSRSTGGSRSSGNPRGGGNSDSGYSPSDYSSSRYPNQQQPPPSGPAYGAGSGYSNNGGYPGSDQAEYSRPRASHSASRNPRPSNPDTSEMPFGRSSNRSAGRSSGRSSRGMSVPLMALVALILVVLLGSLWAKHHSSSSKPNSLGLSRPSVGLLLPPDVVDTDLTHGTTTEGWNW